MINKYQYRDVVWVDLESPTPEEAREISVTFDIDLRVVEELISPTMKPKADFYRDYIYLILHFPILGMDGDLKSRGGEIDFILGRNFIITSRFETIDPLHNFSKVFEVNSILDKSDMGDHAGHIFFYMLRELYRNSEEELQYISKMLSGIEEKIFSGEEKEMVFELSVLNRIILDFKQATTLHEGVLESFEHAGVVLYGEDFRFQCRAIMGEYYKVKNAIADSKEFLEELRVTNDSLLSTKQNEAMKFFTIMAFLTFPLSLIAVIFAMDTHYKPFVGHPNDFWIILGIMFVITLIMIAFFKYKKWL